MVPRVLVLIVAVTLLRGVAAAQVAGSGFDPETAAQISAFSLTVPKAMSLIEAMEELTAYVASSPEATKAMAASLRKPFSERVAILAADPKASAIVRTRGLTPQEYSVGILAVRAAAWASGGATGGLANLASPANVNLFKSNRQLQDAFAKAEAARAGAPK